MASSRNHISAKPLLHPKYFSTLRISISRYLIGFLSFRRINRFPLRFGRHGCTRRPHVNSLRLPNFTSLLRRSLLILRHRVLVRLEGCLFLCLASSFLVLALIFFTQGLGFEFMPFTI